MAETHKSSHPDDVTIIRESCVTPKSTAQKLRQMGYYWWSENDRIEVQNKNVSDAVKLTPLALDNLDKAIASLNKYARTCSQYLFNPSQDNKVIEEIYSQGGRAQSDSTLALTYTENALIKLKSIYQASPKDPPIRRGDIEKNCQKAVKASVELLGKKKNQLDFLAIETSKCAAPSSERR